MMLLMMILLTIISISFLFTIHPLSMGMILMFQTIITSLMTGLMIKTFWFSYILFMIMIGGMLILFLYMTSVASNKKFKFSWKLTLLNLILLSPAIMAIYTNDLMINLTFNKKINLEMMTKFFNFPTNSIMIIMIIYLLITLIAVVKITKMNFGPLRQK